MKVNYVIRLIVKFVKDISIQDTTNLNIWNINLDRYEKKESISKEFVFK